MYLFYIFTGKRQKGHPCAFSPQFAKVSILATININLGSHRAIARNMTLCCIIGQIFLRSHSAVLFKIGNTKSRMGKLDSL